ncbi:hypothetical protein J5N97_003965 [Dioscorea zingiberensis]|uniref:Uncharacterized protein n=1 Tax=Dioscorea zingiberensis TaxID=325984 RepID=A0A9D5HQX7_9LILI|nr:hypothetical protein J5N97_003965 [Dioscorea zingiberensis]
MASTSKELLDLSDRPSKPSVLESLLVNSRESKVQQEGKERAGNGVDEKRRKPLTGVLPTSQVLGKVKDFLGVMAKANEKLEHDVKENSQVNYDIEFLDGNEQEYIEMDLLLGIADLHNEDAVASAEAAMGNLHPAEAPTSSDCSSTDGTDEDDIENENDDSSDKPMKTNSDKEHSLDNKKPDKRPKIIVLD